MSNKLKAVFSNQMFELGGNIQFIDYDSYCKFLDALQLVYENGQTVEVDGVSAINTKIKDGELEYTHALDMNISQVLVGPSIESVPLNVITEDGERIANFRRYQTNSKVIFETGEDEIVFLRLSLLKGTPNINFSYRMQLNKAKCAKEISESLHIALAVIDRLFKKDIKEGPNISNTDITTLSGMKRSFQITRLFFDKLVCLENELDIKFDPSKIDTIDDNIIDVEELFLLLIEKKIVRLNAKLTSTESTGITFEADAAVPELGAEIDITFIGERIYSIYGQDIHVYTANLLSNTVITEIQVHDNNVKKVLYGDTDSKPMYISFSGFKTVHEAKQACKEILPHKVKYAGALTVNEYYKAETTACIRKTTA